ncbi:MAG: outer membrane lipoprotein-sorting protein [Deltaproteobacteria bacterium]|nr:outer membrane lipoprotein-sorting protein [Deltaproteobacteria bacterium]
MKKEGMVLRSVFGIALVAAATLGVEDARADAAKGPSGREIMQRNAEAGTFTQLLSSSTLTIGGPGGDARAKSFTLWRKVAADGVHHRTLTRFNAPAEIKGEGVLFDERTNGQNEVLLYLPRFKKVRRVEAQAQRSSFMGSSFSYTDMTTQAVDDYKHDLTKSEPCPGDAKSSCFVVTSLPANETVKNNHGYARKVTWVRASDYQTIQSELFDVDGALWKRVVFSDIKEVDSAKKKALPHAIRVDDLKTKRFSTIHVSKADVASPISDGMFNEQGLSREI